MYLQASPELRYWHKPMSRWRVYVANIEDVDNLLPIAETKG